MTYDNRNTRTAISLRFGLVHERYDPDAPCFYHREVLLPIVAGLQHFDQAIGH